LLDTVTTTSFTSGGLEGRTYWYFVTAINADNIESALSAYASMIPKPNVPSNVSAAGVNGSVAVRIRWSAVSGAESYRIYYATSLTGTKTLAGTTTPRWEDYTHNGTANTTYYYWVTAVNAGGESDYSLQTSARTPPAAPMNLRATSTTTNSITLAWNAVTGASYYYIDGVTPPTTTGTSYMITGLSPRTWYYFYVQAYNSNGDYGPMSTIEVQTK
jgi:fibronectin type 3 domain-containing protein